MRSNGGFSGAKKTVSTSAASGIWSIRDQQREHGAGVFPTSVPLFGNLRAHFQSDNSASIVSDYGLVTQWNDISGNSRHVTSTGAGRPTTGANTLNGKNVLTFSNGKYLRNYPTQMAMPAFTVIMVLKINNTSDRMFPIGLGNSLGPSCCGGFLSLDFNTYSTVGTRYGMYTSNSSWDTSLTLTTNWSVLTWSSAGIVGQGIAATTIYRVNQVAGAIQARSVNDSNWSTPTSRNGFKIGGGGSDDTAGGFGGQIAEIFMYGSALSANDILTTENYLKEKWAI